MSIRRIELFETEGKQFPTLAAAIDYHEGLIEEFLRKTPGFLDMHVKFRTGFVQHVIDQRLALAKLLSYESPRDDDENDD